MGIDINFVFTKLQKFVGWVFSRCQDLIIIILFIDRTYKKWSSPTFGSLEKNYSSKFLLPHQKSFNTNFFIPRI